MIEYINKRMIDWATWTKRRDDGGLGYSGVASYCNMVSIHGCASAGPIVEDAAEMEIERIMQRMRSELPQRYQVAYWVYLAGSLTMERVARELSCSRKTVYMRLQALHLHVMEELDEATVAAEKRQYPNKFLKVA